MIVYMCVSMERRAAGQSFGNDGGGSGRVGQDMSKERCKRKPQLYKTAANTGKCLNALKRMRTCEELTMTWGNGRNAKNRFL